MSEQDRSNQGPIAGEFSRFLIAGAINTATTYALYLVLLDSAAYLFAYSLAYVAGIVVSYFLNAFFVFRTKPAVNTALRFPLVYVAQYLLGGAVLWICVERLGVRREFGLAFSIAVTIPITYAASRLALKGSLR
jgi:putative flippase GtrA